MSKKRYWCKYCKCWMADTKASHCGVGVGRAGRGDRWEGPGRACVRRDPGPARARCPSRVRDADSAAARDLGSRSRQAARFKHEQGTRHKEEVLAWMKETRARKKEEQQDKDNLAKEMEAIEKAARLQ